MWATKIKKPKLNRMALLCLAAGALTTPLIAETIAIPIEETFRAHCSLKAEAAEKTEAMTVAGKDGWLFLGRELRHISAGKFWGEAATKVSQATKPENADPLPAILDFKAQLDKAGIELLLVPVPPKAVIYPDKISDFVPSEKTPRLDVFHQEFYALLNKNGIKVLDLVPDFLAHRDDAEGLVYCKTDTHWSGRGCVVAAQRIAKEIQNRPWLKNIPKLKTTTQTKTVSIEGDLAKALNLQAPSEETLPLRFVNISKKPIEPSRASPIILLGDSHNLVFHAGEDMLATGAGLLDQLAVGLGFAVDLIAVRGSGATPARISLLRQARANANYLKQKKLVIWCFSAREFTESSGWQKVPGVR
jgi:alginate O-acetyltransferase complex protein AlgJ